MVQIPTWMTVPVRWDQDTLKSRADWHLTQAGEDFVGQGRHRMPISELDAWLALPGHSIVMPEDERKNRGKRVGLGEGVSQDTMNQRYDMYRYVCKQLDQRFQRSQPARQIVKRPNAKRGARRSQSDVSVKLAGRPAQQANATPIANGIGAAAVGQSQATQVGGLAQSFNFDSSAYGVAPNPYPAQYPYFMGAVPMPQLPTQQFNTVPFALGTARSSAVVPFTGVVPPYVNQYNQLTSYGIAGQVAPPPAQQAYVDPALTGTAQPPQYPADMGTGNASQWPSQQAGDGYLQGGMQQLELGYGMTQAHQHPSSPHAGTMPPMPPQEDNTLSLPSGLSDPLAGFETAPELLGDDGLNHGFFNDLSYDALGSDGTFDVPQASLYPGVGADAVEDALFPPTDEEWQARIAASLNEYNATLPHSYL